MLLLVHHTGGTNQAEERGSNLATSLHAQREPTPARRLQDDVLAGCRLEAPVSAMDHSHKGGPLNAVPSVAVHPSTGRRTRLRG